MTGHGTQTVPNGLDMPSTVSAKTSLPVVSGPKIDYELILDCVHCGLCTASCPTYVETGNEADSPRGRIYLMRQVIDGALELDETVKGHIDLCLNCRACETACPSGVQYGKLIEPFREHLEHLDPGQATRPLSFIQRWMLMKIFPSRTRTRLALAPARLSQWTRMDWLARKTGLLRLLPKSLRVMHDMLPPLQRHYGRLPERLPAIGPKRATVGMFLGCVADGLFPQTNYATAKVLQANGCEVWIPKSQGCCGALHYHTAQEETARMLASTNCESFGVNTPEWDRLDAVITNAAGCGAMLKDYSHMTAGQPMHNAATAFNAKVKDVTEFLHELGPVKPTHRLPIRATYHDACHLRHAQQIFKQPRALLELIPGLELVPLPESELCCGAAGSYNLTQPEMATRLGDRKAEQIRSTGATALFTGNVGCLMQIIRHLKTAAPEIWCAHPMDALWASYSGEPPATL
jgi:glycolate oxidase iron-sulfur subunit